MNNEILINIITNICDGYVDSIMTGIEECEEDFPYTIACCKFLSKLKEHNILISFNGAFEDRIVDMVYREMSNYLAR